MRKVKIIVSPEITIEVPIEIDLQHDTFSKKKVHDSKAMPFMTANEISKMVRQ